MDSQDIVSYAPLAIGLISGLVGIWRGNRKASTTRRVLESVVIGVEAASRMPTSGLDGRRLKRAIEIRAVAAGVEPMLRQVVREVAEPTIDDEEAGRAVVHPRTTARENG
ncbi:hypothetical protein ASA1KI_20890 [Opitutales bacterium ASA1]|uniref:hypothetical protein n=1 Tax=Congregicoccus parvus TaxID=3081749 RepID=UPI002B2BB2F7|nr:hypothetical protein ASA1KI_20890 [Opitutales bacterium ASA1]